jgi:Putative transposase DNA-binding domain
MSICRVEWHLLKNCCVVKVRMHRFLPDGFIIKQASVEVIAVSPAYTSQTCHQCLHIGLRSDKRFKCTAEACSWSGDAD